MSGGGLAKTIVAAAAASLLASCSVAPTAVEQNIKEYFSQAEYGPASPRVVATNRPVPTGGGRYMIGEPYRVAGKTYIPRDNPRYAETGLASWYGSAFHGRQTANGEVYDVNGLTAAHPTLPLPSYARVTNLDNGRSLVVRINDRGPFAHDRIIDVSSRVADMLDFKRAGTAKVRVEYVAPARIDGHDTKTLLASYSGPDVRSTGPRFALRRSPPPAGTLVAAVALPPRLMPRGLPNEAFDPPPVTVADPMVLVPAYVPAAAFSDPLAPLIMRSGLATSYTEIDPMTAAQQAAADLARADLATALSRAAARKAFEIGGPPAIVQVGSFSDRTNAERVALAFGRFGDAEAGVRDTDGRAVYVVTVAVASSTTPDAVVDAATAMGLPGAFVTSH